MCKKDNTAHTLIKVIIKAVRLTNVNFPSQNRVKLIENKLFAVTKKLSRVTNEALKQERPRKV